MNLFSLLRESVDNYTTGAISFRAFKTKNESGKSRLPYNWQICIDPARDRQLTKVGRKATECYLTRWFDHFNLNSDFEGSIERFGLVINGRPVPLEELYDNLSEANPAQYRTLSTYLNPLKTICPDGITRIDFDWLQDNGVRKLIMPVWLQECCLHDRTLDEQCKELIEVFNELFTHNEKVIVYLNSNRISVFNKPNQSHLLGLQKQVFGDEMVLRKSNIYSASTQVIIAGAAPYALIINGDSLYIAGTVGILAKLHLTKNCIDNTFSRTIRSIETVSYQNRPSIMTNCLKKFADYDLTFFDNAIETAAMCGLCLQPAFLKVNSPYRPISALTKIKFDFTLDTIAVPEIWQRESDWFASILDRVVGGDSIAILRYFAEIAAIEQELANPS